MPNGSVYEEVQKLSNADILQITSEEKDGLEKVELVPTGPTARKGSSFFASGLGCLPPKRSMTCTKKCASISTRRAQTTAFLCIGSWTGPTLRLP